VGQKVTPTVSDQTVRKCLSCCIRFECDTWHSITQRYNILHNY